MIPIAAKIRFETLSFVIGLPWDSSVNPDIYSPTNPNINRNRNAFNIEEREQQKIFEKF